jgi:predicted acetyltransferase
MIRVRASRRGEEDALAATAYDAFRIMEPAAWQRWFREHSARAPADTLVAEEDGRILGHTTGLRLVMRRRGREVPFRGVAAVAVVPEARRRGVAERLLRAQLEGMRRRREPLALLNPFSAPFYGKLGYGVVEWIELVRATPRQLPSSPLRAHVRKLELPGELPEVQRVYAAARAWSSGLLARDGWWWTERVLARAPDRMGYASGRRLEGYALYEVPREPATLGKQHVIVKELVALTPDAWRGLVGFFEALGEQVGMVELTLPPGGAALLGGPGMVGGPDAGVYHATATLASGAMARIADLAGALALLGGPARGRLGLDLDDPVLGAHSHDVTFGERTAVAAGTRARARLSLRAGHLAQVLFGAVSARQLLARGQISGHPQAASLLDEASAGEPLHLGRLNFF